MRISERGQVTIPQLLRERYGLLPDTEVRFIPEESGVRLVVSPTAQAAAVEALYGRKQFGRSTDEVDGAAAAARVCAKAGGGRRSGGNNCL
ncbi:MAG: AbrB/MazE/SpoVT family DNA-binding domain-containing protein [Candidatus Competibacteraceae bacterium]|nr:AbrB/MazE/SpoVT family DNA-binding domain-containing protein [Candidatus Competibacteraceae bacterium]